MKLLIRATPAKYFYSTHFFFTILTKSVLFFEGQEKKNHANPLNAQPRLLGINLFVGTRCVFKK